jgi:L-threonylcarbamoyladenylate synthase
LGRVENRGNAAIPSAPGQLPHHYAPRTRVELIDDAAHVPPELRASTAILTMQPIDNGLGFAEVRSLSRDGNLEAAAANLFAILRELDDTSATTIYAIPPAETGLGRAIADRLRRAAAASEPEG